ncbi:MAG TPA: hypothetical protein VHQ66_04230 [Myxococcota bacterium]|nr:hypothetical protein [Myxococcota bacterium]
MKLLHSARAQIVCRRARRAALVALAASFVVAGTSAPSHARREIVRWRQPDDQNRTFFQIHVGRQSRLYDQVLYVGRPIAPQGVYAVSLPVADGPAYIAISAYNAAGDGPLSNEIVRQDDGGRRDGARGRGDRGHAGGRADGGRGSRGESLSWPDAGELHLSLHSDPEYGDVDALELRGRIQIDDPAAGIGLTLRDPGVADSFYWLAKDPSSGAPLEVASSFSTLTCDGALPVLEPGEWYRFRFGIDLGDDATDLSAKVWRSGAREPKQWTRCTDTSAERLYYVEPGLWAVGPGLKSWERVDVKSSRNRTRRGGGGPRG